MSDDTHKLQKDPPEGSRKVIEHELERQSGKTSGSAGEAQDQPQSGTPGEKGQARSR